MGDRLFDVNVLARRHGVHHHSRVPVVGSADDYRVNALVIEDRAIIAYLLYVFQTGFGSRAQQMRLVDIADGDDFSVGLTLMNRNQRFARTSAYADCAEAHAIVCAEDFVACETGHRDGGDSPFQKFSAGDNIILAFHRSSLLSRLMVD